MIEELLKLFVSKVNAKLLKAVILIKKKKNNYIISTFKQYPIYKVCVPKNGNKNVFLILFVVV